MYSIMSFQTLLSVKLAGLRAAAGTGVRTSTVLIAALAAAGISLGIAEGAARVSSTGPTGLEKAVAVLSSADLKSPLTIRPTLVVWAGADLDGDGQPDVANPTGRAPRVVDAYGEGRFHASRDGGSRQHEGVDYTAQAGQTVEAPISGYVTKIGYAYPGDEVLRFVEIENPALRLQARVFYVDPSVAVGQTVAVGHPIGRAHSLQQKYPGGITDHVHLEMADARGRKLDAANLIVARIEDGHLSGD
jgi:murein DD-endopeptidase MepM/ murein hydrolase activator NlpD